MILTYKYRLKGKRSARQLRRFAVAANHVWNYCVQTQRSTQKAYRDGLSPGWLSFYDLKSLVSGTSKELELNAQTIQNVCEQFVKSRDTFKKCPRFRKSFGTKKSLGWIPFQKQSRKITSSSVTYLKNTYKFYGAKRRPLPENAKGGCFVEDSRGRWWVCFHVDTPNLPKANANQIGIDLGLKTLATLSNGEKIENIRAYKGLEDKLATAQRAGNQQRAKTINEKIKNKRKDHLHKTTNELAKTYNFIAIGNVNSSQLVRTNFAKSVHDASWSTFRNFLSYKVSRHGGTFLEVDERNTTRMCSHCGDIPVSSPKGLDALGIRRWSCNSCGADHDRDVNAAKNILTVGLSTQPLAEGNQVTL